MKICQQHCSPRSPLSLLLKVSSSRLRDPSGSSDVPTGGLWAALLLHLMDRGTLSQGGKVLSRCSELHMRGWALLPTPGRAEGLFYCQVCKEPSVYCPQSEWGARCGLSFFSLASRAAWQVGPWSEWSAVSIHHVGSFLGQRRLFVSSGCLG